MPRSSLWIPWLFVALGAAFYGGFFSASRLAATAGVPFLTFTFWQAAIGSTVLLVLTGVTGHFPRWSAAHVRNYLATGLLGIAVPVLVIALASRHLPAGIVALAVTLTPSFTFLIALVVGIERWRWFSFGGVGFGLAGVLLLLLPGNALPDPASAPWALLLLVIPACYGTNNVFVSIVAPPQVTPAMRTAGLVLGAAVITLPVMLLIDGVYPWWNASAQGWLAVLWAGSLTPLTFWCMFEIISRAGPIFFGQYNYAIVASGVVWSFIVFSDRWTTMMWAALTSMIIGMVLANVGARQRLRAGPTNDGVGRAQS